MVHSKANKIANGMIDVVWSYVTLYCLVVDGKLVFQGNFVAGFENVDFAFLTVFMFITGKETSLCKH